jgi:hypothetical protein
MKIIEEHREMKIFVENIWRMKDKIEPGQQQLLLELWEWLRVVGLNYYQLFTYKRESKNWVSDGFIANRQNVD